MRWFALTLGALVLAVLLEAAMVTSQVNHALPPGHSLGAWNLEMSPTWTKIISGTAAILAGLIFIRLATYGGLVAAIGLPAMLVGMVFVRLFCGHVLAYPQNSWWLAIFFVTTVVLTLAHTDVGKKFLASLGERLSKPTQGGGPPAAPAP
jgi:uncharacterized membrane protein YozB (DUF420 family)